LRSSPARPRLSKIDASYTGKHESRDKALPEIQAHVERMDKLQYLLYADGRKSLLVILQALERAMTVSFVTCSAE
jgi:hypothetical protein